MSEINTESCENQKTDPGADALKQASDELFNEWTQGVRDLCKNVFEVTEKIHDFSAATIGFVMGPEATANHTRELEIDADKAMSRGHKEAAKHYLERDFAYTVWTQGFNGKDTKRVVEKLQALKEVPLVHEKYPSPFLHQPEIPSKRWMIQR